MDGKTYKRPAPARTKPASATAAEDPYLKDAVERLMTAVAYLNRIYGSPDDVKRDKYPDVTRFGARGQSQAASRRRNAIRGLTVFLKDAGLLDDDQSSLTSDRPPATSNVGW